MQPIQANFIDFRHFRTVARAPNGRLTPIMTAGRIELGRIQPHLPGKPVVVGTLK
jgi:hypothetical protein